MENSFGTQVFNYLKQNFVDESHGGIFSVINTSKNDVVTEDKILVNTALALIVAVNFKDDELAAKQFKDLSLFKTEDRNWYDEMLESSSIKIDVGQVRHLNWQILTALAINVYGHYLNDTNLTTEGVNYFKKVSRKFGNANFSTLLTNDFEILDSKHRLKDIALGAYVARKFGLNDIESMYMNLLQKFKDNGNGGFWSFLDAAYRQLKGKGKYLADQATVLAVLEANEQQKLVSFIERHYTHPYTGGFWSRVNANNEVSVENINSYYGRDSSPFPIKSMLDHVLLLLSLKNVDMQWANHIKQTAANQLQTFWNKKNGGSGKLVFNTYNANSTTCTSCHGATTYSWCFCRR